MKELELKELCRNNPLDQKILIAPSKSIGMQIVNNLAREGYPSINLKVFTIKGLAFHICEEYVEKEVSLVVDKIIGNNLIINILKDLSKDNKDFFFNDELIDSSTAEEVYNTILELKLGGIEDFPSIKNMDLIYKEYKSRLEQLRAMDICDIINKASELVDNNLFENWIFGVASNLEVNKTEEELLNKLPSPLKIKMPVNLIEENRKNYYFKDSFEALVLNNKEIRFFNGYGTKKEIEYIINDIKNRRVPLDDVVIAYTNSTYANLINIEFERENIPVTFGSGLDIQNSSVYRFICTIFSWANKYYGLDEIRPIFANGDIKSPVSSPLIYEELIRRRIIFGRENYIKKLELDNEVVDISEKDKWIKRFFNDVFNAVPQGKVEFQLYIPKLISLITGYVKNINIYDGAATVAVLEILNKIENLNILVNREEYFDIILSYIGSCKIHRTQPQPGKVYAINYINASYTGRKNLYLIGMDSDSLSNKIVESPILLDLMKYRLSNSLSLANESYSYKKIKIKELLTVDFERIYMGYSNFDTVEVKPKFPSQIYNELMEEYSSSSENETPVNWTIFGRDLVKSGTSLEVLAECSRKAYLQYRMGLKEMEDLESSVDKWLDPLQRGIIVHELLSTFLNLEKEQQKDETLQSMVEDLCQKARAEKDSILEEVFIREKDSIFSICKNMIYMSIDPLWEVYANELSFGLEEEISAQTVHICGLSLDIRGSIDRVDRSKENPNVFRIIDYKTGSKSNFDKKLRISTGRGKNKIFDYSQTTKLQYYIYKRALENILEPVVPNAIVNRFSYIFDGDVINIDFDDELIETIEYRIIELLNMDVIKEESMVVYEESKCKYCIYRNICIVDKSIDVEEVESYE